MELVGLHADGSEFPVEISLNPYAGPDAMYTLASMRAITERKATETRIKHLNRILAMQSRINALIMRVHDREELFREACRIAVEAGAFSMAWIGVLETDGSQMRVVASFGERAEEYLSEIESEVPLLAGPAGTAIREDRPVWIQNVQQTRQIRRGTSACARFGWSSLATLPLHRAGVADWCGGSVFGRDRRVR